MYKWFFINEKYKGVKIIQFIDFGLPSPINSHLSSSLNSFKISKLINPEENTEPTAEQEIDLEEKTEDIVNEEIIPRYAKKRYDEWVSGQPEEMKKAILELESDGWTKEKIYNTLNSKEYRDCFK